MQNQKRRPTPTRVVDFRKIEALGIRRWLVRDAIELNLVQNGNSGWSCTWVTETWPPLVCRHIAVVEDALADPDDRRTPPAALALVPIRRLSVVGKAARVGQFGDETLPEAA